MSWIDKAFGVHAQALVVRSERSALLAANIANTDTPGYKARDIDFAETLMRIEGGGGVHLIATDDGHIGASGTGGIGATAAGHIHATGLGHIGTGGIGEAMYRVPTRDASDGNTVESEVEQAAFADNALRYQSSIQFLNGTIEGLRKALRGE